MQSALQCIYDNFIYFMTEIWNCGTELAQRKHRTYQSPSRRGFAKHEMAGPAMPITDMLWMPTWLTFGSLCPFEPGPQSFFLKGSQKITPRSTCGTPLRDRFSQNTPPLIANTQNATKENSALSEKNKRKASLLLMLPPQAHLQLEVADFLRPRYQ